jgi:hypothetical protein
MGQISLKAWPGMTPKNGGGYVYALGSVTLHAAPTPPPNSEPLRGGKEFAKSMLEQIAIRDSVGPIAEFPIA